MKRLILFMTIALFFAACSDEGKSGLNALTSTTDENAGENCENGGLKVDIGLDKNGDGTLDETEITDTKYICNGESGTDGETGDTGDTGTEGEAAACANNRAPVINTIKIDETTYTETAIDIYVNTEANIVVDATDEDDDELLYTINGNSALITDNGSGRYSAIFSTLGTFTYSVTVSDGCQVTTASFTVFISEGLVSIPDGTFKMGSPEEELGRETDETIHYVQLTKGFYMDTFEVTQSDFNELMEYNPSFFQNCGDNCPVEQVTWHETLAYANERSKKEGFEECFDCTGTAPDFECALKAEFTKPQDCKGYRLPTESEWEYAARSGTETALYNGKITETDRAPLDLNLDAIGWYSGNSGVSYEEAFGCTDWYEGSINCGTQPVGEKLSNNFGLYDMTGNVWEWTMDLYEEYPVGTEIDPDQDPIGSETNLSGTARGCGWAALASSCRSAQRNSVTLTYRGDNIGFRLVRTK